MDQIACSVGNLVHIDFADVKNPKVEKVAFDMNAYGYSLCITDTKGSHADLTADYAAIPTEMKAVASYFGKEVLLGLTIEDILSHAQELREKLGDRAVLRALHFLCEDVRVEEEIDALKAGNIDAFLQEDKLLVIDFKAEWCGPCRTLAPIIEELAAEYEGCLLYTSDAADEL